MKKILSISIITFLSLNILGQNSIATINASDKSFPTNINERNIENLKDFEGKVVAFDAIIAQSEISRNNTPFYKLKIGTKSYLWAVLMFKNETNSIGDTIRIVGYLNPIPTQLNGNESEYLDGKFMVIAFGLVDFKNSNFLFLEGAGKQKQEWLDGKIPSSK